jgi:hypothetical protein
MSCTIGRDRCADADDRCGWTVRDPDAEHLNVRSVIGLSPSPLCVTDLGIRSGVGYLRRLHLLVAIADPVWQIGLSGATFSNCAALASAYFAGASSAVFSSRPASCQDLRRPSPAGKPGVRRCASGNCEDLGTHLDRGARRHAWSSAGNP